MKLTAYGIQGRIATWLSEFLGGRLQREWTLVFSGVLQGSILGPLLFLHRVIHIPDLF